MLQGTSSLLNSNSISRINTRGNRNVPFPNIIVMQLERQKPPVKQTARQFKELQSLWFKGLTLNRALVTERRAQEFPEQERNIESLLFDVDSGIPLKVLSHTRENPLVAQLKKLKDEAIASGMVHLIFWVATPQYLDKSIFNEKMALYVLNEYHERGKDKFETLKARFGAKGDAYSANRIFNFICNRLVDYENNLYEVAYTPYGVVCKYVSAFVSEDNPKETNYMIHGWISKYYYPNDEDIKLLLDKKGPNFDISGPFLEGWGRLTTLFVVGLSDLTKPQREFILEKNLEARDQV